MVKFENTRQHVECKTCGEVFLDMDAWEYVKVSRCYANRGKTPAPEWRNFTTPEQFLKGATETVNASKGLWDKFFIKAVLHWCEKPYHTIIVSAPLGNSESMQHYDMTAGFKQALRILGPQYIIQQRTLMEQAYDETAII